ncbi:hypothetical protein [Aurantiacibacter rhizosphaerae]|uniref:Uncharacterized protein n=1 Tax=Aurantiacibacter rhizosphaerae TaxID=2691582 RepID=A0A844XFS4_9SPHN|nr:hypothetical protein [Aurantiacibacter rhizosphaerae]MWV28680.1 hypothetical protein [Aurantiacibacter rhizosphaerae]
MVFPSFNQTFQLGNFDGYDESGARRVAHSSFDARVSELDVHRRPWAIDEASYGPRFAVLDGVGMLGTGQTIDADGNRSSLRNSVSFSEWTLDCGNGFSIRGGRGTYMRCPLSIDHGQGVRFIWRFGTTLRFPGTGADYVGFALARFMTEDDQPVIGHDGRSYDLLCTTLQLPGFANNGVFGPLQTSGWQAHDLMHTGPGRLDGYAEWIVSSGHYFQNGTDPSKDKANAYPCCLALDHIVLI